MNAGQANRMVASLAGNVDSGLACGNVKHCYGQCNGGCAEAIRSQGRSCSFPSASKVVKLGTAGDLNDVDSDANMFIDGFPYPWSRAGQAPWMQACLTVKTSRHYSNRLQNWLANVDPGLTGPKVAVSGIHVCLAWCTPGHCSNGLADVDPGLPSPMAAALPGSVD